MPNIKPFSLFPTLSDNLLSNRFDQIDRLFSQLTGSKPIASPIQTYNLKQIDDNHYELTVSVPGYQENDLSVSLKGSRLLILTIAIEYELPEEEKRQTIAIENKDKS